MLMMGFSQKKAVWCKAMNKRMSAVDNKELPSLLDKEVEPENTDQDANSDLTRGMIEL